MERTQQVVERLERLVFRAALKANVFESPPSDGSPEDEAILHVVWDPVIEFVVVEGLREMIELNSHRIGLNALLRRTYALLASVDERSLDGLRKCLVDALCDEEVFGLARVIEIDDASYLIWRVSKPTVRLKMWRMFGLSSKRSSELTVGKRWRERIEAREAAGAAGAKTLRALQVMIAASDVTHRLTQEADCLDSKEQYITVIESLDDSVVAGGRRNGADKLFKRLNAEQRDLRENDLSGLALLLFRWCEANDLICSLKQSLSFHPDFELPTVQMVAHPK